MQSFDTLKLLAAVDRELLEQRCFSFFECLADQSLDKAMAFIDPQARLTLGSDTRAMPFYGARSGADAIRAAFREILIEYDVLHQDIRDVLLDGDRAVVRRICRMRHRGTGKVMNVDFCDWIQFQDGLMSELIFVPDTLPLVELVA